MPEKFFSMTSWLALHCYLSKFYFQYIHGKINPKQ